MLLGWNGSIGRDLIEDEEYDMNEEKGKATGTNKKKLALSICNMEGNSIAQME